MTASSTTTAMMSLKDVRVDPSIIFPSPEVLLICSALVGHTCVTVDDLDAACKRFDDMGVQWKKRLTDGRMKNVAFILGKNFLVPNYDIWLDD